jgi:hypothetical protein
MQSTRSNLAKTYFNAMEMLVDEEVRHYLSKLPDQQQAHINRLEVAAYALNQLPPLYATSEKGLRYQLRQGRFRYASQIRQAVQRAIVGVMRDPLLNNTPLTIELPGSLRTLLYRLHMILNNENEADWNLLPELLNELLREASNLAQAEDIRPQIASRSAWTAQNLACTSSYSRR